MNSREASFAALLAFMREEVFISKTLEAWQQSEQPSVRDFHLAQEIASGSSRMAIALDYIAGQLSTQKKLSLKLKERLLMRIAIYQRCFMTRIPLYAIVDETIEIAKKHCHPIFIKYLNATLRKLEKKIPSLPAGRNPEALSIRYSYPLYFVKELCQNHGAVLTEHILETGNKTPLLMARVRKEGFKVEIVQSADLHELIDSPDYYIQNSTPVKLLEELTQEVKQPMRILDLCAAPGGKSIALHDHFPNAKLYANDVSGKKLSKLRENFEKYGIKAQLSCGLGEEFVEGSFDIIVLDVPCSNSGVLNKRPEARWRLTPEALDQLKKIQMKLISHAKTLLAPNGEIWYMTCSILKNENEKLIQEACQAHSFYLIKQKLILPSKEGGDGGFACALKRSE